jgi:hypothetical protein
MALIHGWRASTSPQIRIARPGLVAPSASMDKLFDISARIVFGLLICGSSGGDPVSFLESMLLVFGVRIVLQHIRFSERTRHETGLILASILAVASIYVPAIKRPLGPGQHAPGPSHWGPFGGHWELFFPASSAKKSFEEIAVHMASNPDSPVRIRIASSILETKILPSPTRPV